MGLLWRVSRKTVFLQNGGLEEDFIDVEPWTKPAQGQVAEPAADDGAPKGSGVKEHVLKMASLLDQSDESELMPPGREKVQEWVQRYITVMGAPPEEEEEATDAQLAALYKRTIVLKQAPYCDFSVWTPYGRRALRSQKFRTFAPAAGQWRVLDEGAPGSSELLAVAGQLEGLQGGGDFPQHCLPFLLAAVREMCGAADASLASDVGPYSPGRR